MTKVQQDILRAIAFFEVFEFAPTQFELQNWLEQNWKWKEVEKGLQGLVEKGVLEVKDSVIARAGRGEESAEERRKRAVHGIRKNIKARSYIRRIASWVPGVRGVAICNTRLPFLHAKNESDIDLLVISRTGMIWITRLLLVGIVKVLHRRPGEVMRDAFDHSMFISERALNMKSIADINSKYVAAWVKSIEPVYGERVWQGFEQENQWVTQYFAAYNITQRIGRWRIESSVGRRLAQNVGAILSPLERAARALQKHMFTDIVRRQVNKGTAVITNNDMLKFHTGDKREEYKKEYEKICAESGV